MPLDQPMQETSARIEHQLEGVRLGIHDLVADNARLRRHNAALRQALHAPALDAAHQQLAALLEETAASPEAVWEAAVELCAALEAHQAARQAARAAESAPPLPVQEYAMPTPPPSPDPSAAALHAYCAARGETLVCNGQVDDLLGAVQRLLIDLLHFTARHGATAAQQHAMLDHAWRQFGDEAEQGKP
ncbi:MAG: hypothetical protein AB7N91_15390 [Candidatus Tectimicrobiota bacterium]